METFKLESEALAVKALGSLFRLTEVFLWDDASADTREKMYDRGLKDSLPDYGASSDTVLEATDCSPLPDDMELAQQLSALGLPLSFQTNKERRNVMTKGKRKDLSKKLLHDHEGKDNGIPDLVKVDEVDIASPTILDDKKSDSSYCLSILRQSETSCHDLSVDVNRSICCPAEEEDSANLNARNPTVEEQPCDELSGAMSNHTLDSNTLHNNVLPEHSVKTEAIPKNSEASTSPRSVIAKDIDLDKREQEGLITVVNDNSEIKKLYSDTFVEQPQGPGVVAYSQSSEMLDHNGTNQKYDGDFGGWILYWDSFYERNYFYNIKTHESTWDPPPGLEHLVFAEVSGKAEEIIVATAETSVNPRVSFHHHEQLDSWGLQSYSDAYRESKNDSKSLDQPPSASSGAFDLPTDNFNYLITKPVQSCSSERLNKTQEINENCYAESSSHLLSEHIRSHHWGDETAQSGFDMVCSKDLTEELDCSGKVDTAVKITSSGRNQSRCPCDNASQSPESTSFNSAITNTLTEETGNGISLLQSMDAATDELESESNFVTRKQKKKARKRKQLRKSSSDFGELQVQGILEEASPNISKYWWQRYLLFSRFDDGIRMDEEGWFSVTPEPIARHHALRCGTGTIVDCFTGVGGNAIQFAQRSQHVIAIDIDPKKIDYAHHNAAIYGVHDHIDFIRGDSFFLAQRLKADTVFLSPPWGGPDYAKVTTYDIKTMLKPHDGHVLFNIARGIAPKVVMFLPRNTNINQLAELSLSANPPWSLEVEKNYLNGKLKAITAYFVDASI